MTALFQPAELHSSTTQTETARWRNWREPKKLQTWKLKHLCCLFNRNYISWCNTTEDTPHLSGNRYKTCLINKVTCFFLTFPALFTQRVLPKHQQAAVQLQSHPSAQQRSLSTDWQEIHLLHSPPILKLLLRIPRVGSLSLAPLCHYLVTLVWASRKWLQCLLSLILMPSPRRLRKCWLIIILVGFAVCFLHLSLLIRFLLFINTLVVS